MPPSDPPLSPAQLARVQEAQVATSEANARKAAADADAAGLSFALTRFKSLVPDLTGIATDAVVDKSGDVSFSGLVTYSALTHAAEIVAHRVAAVLPPLPEGQHRNILVTTQTDLLTNDLLANAVTGGLEQLLEFADQVLALTDEPAAPVADEEDRTDRVGAGSTGGRSTTPAKGLLADLGAAIGTGATTTAGAIALGASGPVGLAAAAAAAIPSIVSLFSATTTVKGQTETLTDLATTTAVLSAVAEATSGYGTVHEDFRLAPTSSAVRAGYAELVARRTALVLRQLRQPAGGNTPGLALLTSAVTGIDAFITTVNAVAAGARSPLSVAVLNELLHEGGDAGIDYVLSVKGLGGQSEEYTKDRHVGFDTYTTLADASVSFLLHDTAAKRTISSGVASGVSSVHGRLGHPPTGLVGPNAADAVDDLAADAAPVDAEGGHPGGRWRHLFGGA